MVGYHLGNVTLKVREDEACVSGTSNTFYDETCKHLLCIFSHFFLICSIPLVVGIAVGGVVLFIIFMLLCCFLCPCCLLNRNRGQKRPPSEGKIHCQFFPKINSKYTCL